MLKYIIYTRNDFFSSSTNTLIIIIFNQYLVCTPVTCVLELVNVYMHNALFSSTSSSTNTL